MFSSVSSGRYILSSSSSPIFNNNNIKNNNVCNFARTIITPDFVVLFQYTNVYGEVVDNEFYELSSPTTFL